MKAIHLKSKKTLEFWQVDKLAGQPDWVAHAFESGGFSWTGQKLHIVNTGGLIKISANLGDMLVFNGKYLKIVPERKFKSDYRVL